MVTPSLRLTITALLLCTASAPGQVSIPWSTGADLRVDVNMVLVPVTVTDRRGKVLSGLDGSQFRVYEEGVPQRIATFSIEELPVSVGVVLDISGSMKQKLSTARSLVRTLFGITNSSDEAMVLTFADRPGVQTNLTPDMDRLQNILEGAKPGGCTSLIDSVYTTLERMKPARNTRKVVVIVSDGQDNHSRHTARELISRAIESEAQIYSVAVREPAGTRKAIELTEENRGAAFLSDLAQASGGVYFQVDNDASIPTVAEKIGLALHHQYLIGYYPSDPLRAGLRRIQIKLDLPDVRLYSRTGYYAVSP
jgi:Ca-activated chloride channel family protein